MSYRDFKGIMRPGQNKRRGRNPNNPGNPNNPNPNNPNQNRQRGPHRIQTFDSSGPSVKIRGNAYQVFERYVALAREAALSGDRIAAENLYQHAEHYFRVMNANGEGQPHAPRPTTPADNEMSLENDPSEQPTAETAMQEPRSLEPRQAEHRHGEGRHSEGRQPEGRHEGRQQEIRQEGRPQETRPREPRQPERQPEPQREHDHDISSNPPIDGTGPQPDVPDPLG